MIELLAIALEQETCNYRRWPSTAVAFALLTELPQVGITALAEIFFYYSYIWGQYKIDRTHLVLYQSRDFAIAVSGKGLS